MDTQAANIAEFVITAPDPYGAELAYKRYLDRIKAQRHATEAAVVRELIEAGYEETVRQLIHRYTEARDLGVFGDPGVNVLELNRALDQ